MPGPRDRTYRGYLLRENPWLRLQGGTTSAKIARLRRGIRDRVDLCEHATVFSVQDLICSVRGNTILNSHSDSLGASLKKTGAGHSVSNQF